MTWRSLLDQEPSYGSEPLGHAALEDRVAAAEERYRDRMQGLATLQQVEAELEAQLDRVFATDRHQRTWFDDLAELLPFLGPTRPTPLRAEALQHQHQAALHQVRSLGHHLDALERDVAMVDAEIAALSEQVVGAARDSETASRCERELREAVEQARRELENATGAGARELESAILRLEAQVWSRHQEQRRFRVTEDRLAEMVRLHRELRELLHAVHGDLVGLQRAAAEAVETMGRQVGALAADASRRDLRDVTGADVEALRQSLQRVSHLARDSAGYLSERSDALERELERLDRQARMRRRAEEEVERLLARVRGES
jgi:chromosome segregation ATPase